MEESKIIKDKRVLVTGGAGFIGSNFVRMFSRGEFEGISEITVLDTSLEMVLFVIFLTLKLTGVIDWSWWWITSPLWIPVLFMLTVLGIGWLVIMNSDR